MVGNLLHRGDSDTAVEARSRGTAEIAADRAGPTVVVRNEVGMGVHPETALGTRYRDLLGRVNQQWAAAADTSLLLVAGRAVALTDRGGVTSSRAPRRRHLQHAQQLAHLARRPVARMCEMMFP